VTKQKGIIHLRSHSSTWETCDRPRGRRYNLRGVVNCCGLILPVSYNISTVDRRTKLRNTCALFEKVHAAKGAVHTSNYCNACKMSFRMSSLFSSPAEIRIIPGVMPAANLSSLLSFAWVVLAGWEAMLLVSPRLAVRESI
jgi:hypothetical protein